MAIENVHERKKLLSDEANNVVIKSDCGVSEVEVIVQQEGGYGWLVVFASFLVVCVLDGVGYSYGVYLGPLLEDMDVGRGILSMAGSAQVGVYGLSSPIVALLVNRYGERFCCMLGSMIAAVGLLGASFATGIVSLIAGYSIITGLGFGLMYIPAVVIVPQHFTVRRSLATGLVLCAAGAGTFVIAPLAQEMVDLWGWRGSMRGLSVLCLLCVLCGAVMTPGDHGINRSQSTRSTGGLSAVFMSPMLPVFILLSIADMFSTLALYIPYTYLPGAAVGAGLTPGEGAVLVSTIGLSNALGRILAGWIVDQPWIKPLTLTAVVISSSVLPLYLFAVSQQLWQFLILSAIFGLMTGGWVSCAPAALIELLGVEMLTQTFGLLTGVRGLAALSGPPIAGLCVDKFGSPGVALLVAGSTMTGAAVFYIVTVGVNRKMRGRSAYQEI